MDFAVNTNPMAEYCPIDNNPAVLSYGIINEVKPLPSDIPILSAYSPYVIC